MDGSIIATTATRPAIFDRLTALADPIRCRLLLLLEGQELTVSELCAVTQLPQSTVSRHLKVLAEDGWVAARKDGASRRYAATVAAGDGPRRELWSLVRADVEAGRAVREDRRRLGEVLSRRRSRSQEFFRGAAGEWAQLREQLFGRRFDLLALLGLLDDRWTVGDLGAGTGLLARSLAPFVERVVAVDESPEMLDAAGQRLRGLDNVELRQGRLEELPIEADSLDAATLILVLHHLPKPERALAEAYRTLRPGGRLLIVDMLPHEREEFRREMGHLRLGFPRDEIRALLEGAGFEGVRTRPLPPDPRAKGPSLFAASGRKPAEADPETNR